MMVVGRAIDGLFLVDLQMPIIRIVARKSPVPPYDRAAVADPYEQSRKSFEALIAELESEPVNRSAHHVLEELVETRGRDVLRQVLQDYLDRRAFIVEIELAARQVSGRPLAGRTRIEHGHTRVLASVVGPVTVRRAALRAPGQRKVYPADVVLSLPAGRHSHGVRRLAVLAATRSSYDTAKTAIESRCGPIAGKRQLEQLVVAAAVGIDDFYAAKVPAPAGADTLLVLSADGKGVVMRPEALREPTRRAATAARPVFRTWLASGEKPNRKRMSTLAAVYDTEPAPAAAP